MTKLLAILRHITVVLAFMFLVFLVLDQFNPMMNFIDNAVSRWLLAGLCVSGVMQSAVGWGRGGNALSSGSPRATAYGKRGLRAAICGLLALSLPAAGARQKAAKKHGCDAASGGDVG